LAKQISVSSQALNGDKEPKINLDLSIGEGKTDQGFVNMYGENINLIDLRQQRSG
jgi:hypothetical protein